MPARRAVGPRRWRHRWCAIARHCRSGLPRCPTGFPRGPEQAADAQAAAAAADAIGYPVVLKTDEPGIAHKSDVGGVLLGLRGPKELAAGYADLAGRLGRRVLVCAAARPGVELALGIVRDPYLGPLIVVGAGGILVELLADRVGALRAVRRDRRRRPRPAVPPRQLARSGRS